MILGLSPIDFSILMGFLILILAIGLYVSRSVKNAADFYLGGRKLGRGLQFFLNFGNATDTNAAPTMASSVFKSGASGVWLQLQTLLFTPLFWFTQPWFRRARLTTMADFFVDRYRSKACASAYALFNVIVALLTLGVGNLAGLSVAEGMMLKDRTSMTQNEIAEVDGAGRLVEIGKMDASLVTPEITAEKNKILELQTSLSHDLRKQIPAVTKLQFYVSYNLIVAIFIMLGGLKAAAITDAIQGILILFMSLILLPLGLAAIGGFSGLHMKIVDPTKFYLSGTANTTFTWYSIAAFTFSSFMQIVGLQHNMSAAGSATNENTARFGMLTGGFLKRLVLICWMLCGFLALALLTGKLDNPDYAWGAVSKLLLPVGISGVMLSGMLLGHMPSVGLTSVAVSGLVVRNLYQPLVKDKSPEHYLNVGKVVIVVVLASSVLIAWNASDLGSLWSRMLLFNTFFGAVFILLLFWRRQTAAAILISVGIWLLIQAVAPLVVGVSPISYDKNLLLSTKSADIYVDKQATQADVDAGRAAHVNDIFQGPVPRKTAVLFFDKIEPKTDKHEAYGSFFITENYLVYKLLGLFGVDMQDWSVAQVNTARYLFDGFFPFLCLILISLVTKPSAPDLAPAFYAKMRTPVAPTPELDQEEVERSRMNPSRFDDRKLLPHSQWEFAKWDKADFIGFFGCCSIVLVILCVLYAVLHIGT